MNQDSVWGYALLLNGLFLVFAVYRFGAEKLRREAVNEVRLYYSLILMEYWFVVWNWRLETSTNMGLHDIVSEAIVVTIIIMVMMIVF